MEEQIKLNAELMVQQGRQLESDFGYTPESVKWLEGYIERLRESGHFDSDEMKNKLTSVFGSFLGECVIRCYGGTWTQQDGEWCVAFNHNNGVFPFAKVGKQIEYGLEDSIASFFETIPIVFKDVPLAAPPTPEKPEPQTPKKPWWKVW